MKTKVWQVPTVVGRRQLELVVGRSLPLWSPGRALASERGLVMALRPEVVAGLDEGDHDAQLIVLHELAHVVLHVDVLAGAEPRRPRGDLELEADLLAGVIQAVIGRDR